MARLFYHTMQDNAGNLLFDVSGTMRLAGSGTLATIYGDEALTVILPNPMTNHPSFGSFKCFLPVGDFDFYMAKSGYTFETLTGVQGFGTLAQQDAASVTVTRLGVGTPVDLAYALDCIGPTRLQGDVGTGVLQANTLNVLGAATMNGALECESTLHVEGQSFLNRTVLGGGSNPTAELRVDYDKTTYHAIQVQPMGSDTGPGFALYFQNVAGGTVGTIQTNATTTTYNTTSDARLKKAIAALTGELDLIKALRPVSFLWNADDTPGVGFLAHEVAALVQGVITGEPDALDDEGRIVPQQIDHSKLVPFLVGAVQTLAARLVVLEDALGI